MRNLSGHITERFATSGGMPVVFHGYRHSVDSGGSHSVKERILQLLTPRFVHILYSIEVPNKTWENFSDVSLDLT